tara:strand:+ start:154 stop:1122 length:969 start_codon:yes stop_codon:yes gene_type:complete
MTFFNKKEEVMSIELTPYGRSLLAKGKLMPSYYAFFDDDILYDSEAAGFSETNNEVFQRIISETPRLKPQRDITSSEGRIFNNERSEEEHHPHTRVKLNYLTEPMGTSDQKSDNAPSWKNTFIQGELTGSSQSYLTGSNVYLRQIPQIESVIEYTMEVRNEADDSPVQGQESSPTAPVSQIFPDGSYIHLDEEQILCQLKEIDGFLFKDGIEVEVFMYDDTESENLIPLKFLPRNKSIVNGMLVGDEERFINDVNTTPMYVEYYLNLNLDKEISTTDICAGVNKLKANDIQIGIEVDCPDVHTADFDIYGTRVGDSDVEICE